MRFLKLKSTFVPKFEENKNEEEKWGKKSKEKFYIWKIFCLIIHIKNKRYLETRFPKLFSLISLESAKERKNMFSDWDTQKKKFSLKNVKKEKVEKI